MDDTWQSEEAWIAIGWPKIFAIGQTIAITWSSSDGRNRSRFLVRPISITQTPDLHQEWITIERLAARLIGTVGSSSDGGGASWRNSKIAARSSRDRRDPSAESVGIHLQPIDRRLAKHQRYDWRPIVAWSWSDRGENRGGNRSLVDAKLKPNPS